MNTFDRLESEVRSYCRAFPVVFTRARGPFLYDESGREYVDFFTGAGTLNYGHNNPAVKQAVMRYLEDDGIVHGLDMWTAAKRTFLETFESAILGPRGLSYRTQFTGPTGTNAIEAALKLVRKIKKRTNIVAFTNAYHGLSAGALSLTGNRHFRGESYVNRLNACFMPYDGYFGPEVDTIAYFRRFLEDNSSGLDIPAAVILETVQAEGGVNVAGTKWLKDLESLCREFDMLLICDDIQVGNGRTGKYFSFEHSGIRPDIVVLSKAIGGMGLPMSIVLIAPELDQWKPAEHTGTFRGNNLAFVASAAALKTYWQDDRLEKDIARKGDLIVQRLEDIRRKNPSLNASVRGRGMIRGLAIPADGFSKAVSQEAFRRGLIIELAGADDQVVKFLPPLTIEDAVLVRGLDIVEQSIGTVMEAASSAAR